jgi:hypothetical protein
MNESTDNQGLLDTAIDADDEQTTSGQDEGISHVNQPEQEQKEAASKPDYWPEKFWKKDSNEPDLEGISKSYAELEKQFRSGKHKAPEGGKYDISALEGVAEDDPLLETYKGWAAKNGISQQAFEELASQFVQMGTMQEQQVQMSVKQEREALGPNADAIIANMSSWAKGLVQKGIWGKEDIEEFKVWGGTAKGIQALMKLRETYEGRVPVDTLKNSGEENMSEEELKGMVSDPRYKTDEGYRKKVEKLFEKFYN